MSVGGAAALGGGAGEADVVGRDDDLLALRSFVDRSGRSGGALLLFGEPGVGKTVLLGAAAGFATGTRVLMASGTQFEAAYSFSTLHQALHPLIEDLAGLSPAHRRTLGVALGVRHGSPPGLLMIANATLALLDRVAATGPVLLMLDDLHWLDRASAIVLAIVARRLPARVGLLAAYRTGEDSFFDRSGLPEHEVRPLDDRAATTLVTQRFPALAPRVRRRLLAEAQGNPLALLELPLALTDRQQSGMGSLPEVLPLNRRLQAAFESRVRGLPEPTRRLLLLAALDSTGRLDTLTAGDGGLAALALAERAGLVHVDEHAGTVAFHHPLTRSAVVDLSTVDARVRAHADIAASLAHRPELHAWHMARATIGTDEGVARLLEDAAHTTRSRGDAAGAVTALLRAADLSPVGADRSRRLAEAAYLGAVVTGDLRDVPRLLADALEGAGERDRPLVSAVAAAHHLLLSGEGDVDTAHRLLVGAIEMQPTPYDGGNATLVEAFYTLGWVCYFGGRAELWTPFRAAFAQLTAPVPELLALLAGTFADPARTAPAVLGRIDQAIAGLTDHADPVWSVRVGLAAMFVDRLTFCRTALSGILGDDRGAAVTLSLHARSLIGLDQMMTGEWDEMRTLAEEHVALCRTHDYRLLECIGLYLLAMPAAARGEHDTVKRLTDRMTMWATPRRAGLVSRIAAQAMLTDALGRGDFEEAYRHATVITPAGELADHVPHALWVIMDVVEAAARTGRLAEAAAHVSAARACGVAEISARLAMTVEGAAALVATDEEAPARFAAALAVAGGERWPFDRARIALAYGERLRRGKATTEARRQLTAALDTFQRLDARPWAARAAAELRATGQTVGHLAPAGPGALTPQQREIAELAAAGLSNKQIGERLFLSPRTVGSHLYQTFPKLGITSRAALRDALADTGVTDPPTPSG
ncbi:LuxR family transcriptional regulator [Dactylosporangium sp. AC04546]|uniref:helix-turn-helix transcriptional regulator n=1 Tax=Dactylosporangium sp. AC04546 TaxID=2862460 RepID=UPI002E7BFDA0|nr:LuxR family transcriptional regulator [Dactylosporangium sp. AC04546]WVK79546.1 LuxR family transcriptional regulator [Dactylosporangium sp. AC04546]